MNGEKWRNFDSALRKLNDCLTRARDHRGRRAKHKGDIEYVKNQLERGQFHYAELLSWLNDILKELPDAPKEDPVEAAPARAEKSSRHRERAVPAKSEKPASGGLAAIAEKAPPVAHPVKPSGQSATQTQKPDAFNRDDRLRE